MRDLSVMKVMVTGAAGFLGRAMCMELSRRGAEVVGVDRVAAVGCGVEHWVIGDLGEGLPADAFKGVDALVHLAWSNVPATGNTDMAEGVRGNVASSVKLFETAVAHGVKRLVYPSSGGTVYGSAAVPTNEDAPLRPQNGYAAGKAAVEHYLNALHYASRAEVCILRIANPYGPGQSPARPQGFIAVAINQVLAHAPVRLFGGRLVTRDFVYIADVAEALALSVASSAPNATWNLGSGEERGLGEVLDMVFDAIGHSVPVEEVPRRVVDIERSVLDIGRIREALDWRPRMALAEGVRATVAWQRALS